MIFASKQFQRINNFALAALLVVSTITASVPFLFSQTADALASNTVTTTSLPGGWYLGETRSAGSNTLVPGGLKVKTVASGGSNENEFSKAAGYYPANFNLSDAGETDINLASYSGARPSLQLGVDRDNNGTWDGYLVYEPWAYGASNFWTSKTGFGVPSGQGYTSLGTLAEFSAANPNAKVISIGYSLGSGVIGEAVISRLVSGGTQYTFDALPLAAPTNLIPANNSFTNNPGFSNSWSAVAGADRYEYRTSYSTIDGALGSIIYQDSSQSSSSRYNLSSPTVVRTNISTPDATYYWQVRAGNASGTFSEWSPVSSVTVDTVTPAVPVVSATGVANGESTNVSPVTVNWLTPSGAVKYDYRVWTNAADSRFNSPGTAYVESNLSGNSRTGTFSEGQGTYFIQLRAYDAAGNVSDWSETFAVTYDIEGPAITGTGFTRSDNVVTPEFAQGEDMVRFTWTAGTDNPVDGADFDPILLNPDFTITEDGEYEFTLTAFDAAGNTTSRLLSFNFTTLVVSEPPTTTTNTVAPLTPPAAGPAFTNVIGATANQGVLGATTENAVQTTGETGVQGTSDENIFAAAANSEQNNGTIFGLAWYWWILILAALALIAWSVIAAIRRRDQEQA